MPVHDWTKVRAGIFHDFHHEWVSTIKHALNDGILPEGYYSMAEQQAGPFGPDVLTLETLNEAEAMTSARHLNGPSPVLARPRRKATAESEMAFYRRKKKVVTVRHVSDDGIVAIVEIVSPGNKSGIRPFRTFVEKAAELVERQIHLLIVDIFPAGKRDPSGVHGAIWEELTGQEYRLTKRKPLTVVSYESGLSVRAFVEHLSIGDELPEMSLFLELGGCVEVPLEATYRAAFAEVPKRWRDVLY
jgi:hypothetical protein